MKTSRLFKAFALAMAMLLLVSSLGIGVLAESRASKQTAIRTEEAAQEYVQQYAREISAGKTEYSVTGGQRLESFSDKKSYVLYTLSPSGYAVYDAVSGVVEEMMLDCENPYDDSRKGELYYGGPMNYIRKVDGKYFMITDGTRLSKSDVEKISEIETAALEQREAMKGVPTTTQYYYMNSSNYFTALLGNKFGTNTNGTCVQVASAIMLSFYDRYVNGQFVPAAYEDIDSTGCGTTEDFHLLLQSFMGTGPCTFSGAASGLNSYLASIYFSEPTVRVKGGKHNIVFDRVSGNVGRNKPTVIGMSKDYNPSCTMNHAVVAYGYRTEMNGGAMVSAAYFVHTGWKSQKLGTFAWDWFSDALYIG